MTATNGNKAEATTVDVLRKGATFHSDYCCKHILSEILGACPVRSDHRLVIHAQNARPRMSERAREFMEKGNMRSARVALSHLIWPTLIGHIKGKLQRTEFREKDDLLAEIREILNGTPGKGLKTVFLEWKKRPQTCINSGGEHPR